MPAFSPGPPNCVWFQVLKLSARNSKRVPRDSLSRKLLNSERFQLSRPGPRSASKPRLPQVPAAGKENAAGSNHCLTVCGYEIFPVRSGRLLTSPSGNRPESSPEPDRPGSSGAPVCMVTIPDSSHPPKVALSRWLDVLRNAGMSYMKLTKATWVRSNIEGPTSYRHPPYGLVTASRSPPFPRTPRLGSIARDSVYATCKVRSRVIWPRSSVCSEL